jgi:hypothetical protein
MAIGLLAYGSLLDYPGRELDVWTSRRIAGVETPFNVEFARSAQTRGGAPTLVPVEDSGASVDATVLVLEDTIMETSARDMLYRRETHRVDARASRPNVAWIKAIRDFAGLDTCLYTALPENIDPLSATHLAELAIASASGPAGAERLDGISYLMEQKRRALTTPLMPSYEAEILSRTGARDLKEAWNWARAQARLGGQP